MSNGSFADYDNRMTYFHNSNGTASVNPNDRYGIAGDVNYILPSFTVDGQLYLVTQLDFFNCPNITSITIPQYVTNINFFGSTNLNAINIDINNTNFSVDNNVIFNKNKTTLICYLAKPTNSSYTIPSSVTAISNGAFQDASSLTNILIPSSMTTISAYAFSWSFLQKIVIPSSVSIIENYAFSNCNSLNNVFFLGDIPIMNKNSWEQLTTNFTKEGDYAYYITGAQNTDRLIPLFNGVQELSRQQMYTFGGNHLIPALLAGGVPVADLVTAGVSIYWLLVAGVSAASLLTGGVSAGTLMDEGVSLADLIAAGLTSFYTDTNNVVYYYETTGSRVVDSPNASGNIEIKSSITVNAVVYSVRTIISSAFKNNVNITGVIIPSTITYIGNRSFQGCTQLSKVYFKGLPVCDSYSFSPIYLPGGALAGTVYIKEEYQPYPWSMPTEIRYLNQFFNIVYLESSVIDAFAFTPPAAPAPASPTGLVATISGTTATINFTQPSNDSAAVTSYTYATSSDNITYSSFVNTNLIKVSATQVSISGLTLGSTYYFKLIADNGSPSVASTASNSVFVNFPPATPTITNIRSTGGVTSISFQNPSDTSITNYAYSTINVIDIHNFVLPPFSSYTLLSPAQNTSPLTINGLHGVVQIKIKAFNGSYSNESTSFNNWYEPPFV